MWHGALRLLDQRLRGSVCRSYLHLQVNNPYKIDYVVGLSVSMA